MMSILRFFRTHLLLCCVIFSLFYITATRNLVINQNQQYSYLANSFLEGKVYFTQVPIYWGDTAQFRGHNYWPLGPFPAVLLMPFVLIFNIFGSFFFQGYLQIFLVMLTFTLVYKISKRSGFSLSDSLYWAFAFTFASVFLGVALDSGSWYFAHTVATPLLLLAILEFLGSRRYLLIGILFSLAFATRFSILPAAIFFAYEVFLNSNRDIHHKLNNALKFLTPVAICLALLALYDYLRFGNMFEQGYSYQILEADQTKARSYGLFSLAHLPGNLYYFLLSTPLPLFKDGVSHVLRFPFLVANIWGMSIIVTSPYFIYLFFLKYKDNLSKILIITVFCIAFPILLYFAIGAHQFGYRYSLDFLPFLYLLLIRNYYIQHKTLSFRFRLVIILTFLSNLYLYISLLYLN